MDYFTVQQTIGKDWNVEVAYLGSNNTRLGLPESNITNCPAVSFPGREPVTRVTKPYSGQIPASSSLGIGHDRSTSFTAARSAIHHRALCRDNVGNSSNNACRGANCKALLSRA